MAKPTNIQDLSPRVAAKLLSETKLSAVTEGDVRRWIKEGAPSKRGRVNLIKLAAWLLREVSPDEAS